MWNGFPSVFQKRYVNQSSESPRLQRREGKNRVGTLCVPLKGHGQLRTFQSYNVARSIYSTPKNIYVLMITFIDMNRNTIVTHLWQPIVWNILWTRIRPSKISPETGQMTELIGLSVFLTAQVSTAKPSTHLVEVVPSLISWFFLRCAFWLSTMEVRVGRLVAYRISQVSLGLTNQKASWTCQRRDSRWQQLTWFKNSNKKHV